MMYLTTVARDSARQNIRELIDKIGSIPGNHLDYISARQVIHYLNMLGDQIAKEDEQAQ